jgi:Tol biopolymer transport system component
VTDGVNTSGGSLDPSISSDGRYVAFTSDAPRAGVYWKDMDTGEIRPVDVPLGATTSNGIGLHPRISGDGRFVAFDSDATDLPGGEQNGAIVDVFRRDMDTGLVQLVSQGNDGGAQGDSTTGSISADGNVVAFSSSAPNLADGDTNGTTDTFVRNMVTAAVARVSAKADGGQLSGPSYAPAVSGDGHFVAFASRAPDVQSAGVTAVRARVYRKDLQSGAIELATVGLDLPPRTSIDAPLGTLPRRKLRAITGTTEDDSSVAHVDVALSRSVGGGRCLWLGKGSRVVRARCERPVWVRARLASGLRFSLQVRHLLPRGTWHLRARAMDAQGTVEPRRTGTNALTIRLL